MTLENLKKLYDHYVAIGNDEAVADIQAAMKRKPQPPAPKSTTKSSSKS